MYLDQYSENVFYRQMIHKRFHCKDKQQSML